MPAPPILRAMLRATASLLAALAQPALPAESVQPADAQDTGQCLAFGPAITVASRHDSRAALAQARADRASAELDLEKGTNRPQFSAFARSGIGDGFQADNEFDNRFGLRVSQRLFSFGRGRLARDAASQREQAAQYDIGTMRTEIAAEAATRFLAAARAEDEAASLAEMNLYYERAAAEAPVRLQAGLLKQSEAVGVEAENARLRVRQSSATLRARQQQTFLSTLIGQMVSCINSPTAPDLLRTLQPPNLDGALSESATASPELRSLQAQVNAAELDRRRLARSRLPEIGVSGTSALNFGNNANGFTNSNRLGLDVNLPLYQGGQIAARTAAAGAEGRIVRAELETRRRAIEEETRIAWLSVSQQREVVRLSEQMLGALTAQTTALQREYDLGLVTLTEVIDAKRQEADGRLAAITARYDLLESQLRLASLTGRIQQFIETEG